MIPKTHIAFWIFIVGLIGSTKCLPEVNHTYVYIKDCLLFYTRGMTLHLNHNETDIILDSNLDHNDSVCTSNEAKIVFKFDTNDSITNLTINMNFIKDGYETWSFENGFISYECENETNCPVNESITGNWMTAPKNFSYHCTNPQLMTSGNTYIKFDMIQIQLFGTSKSGIFDSANDCIGFFTTGIWMVLVVTSVLLGILAFGLYMVLRIETSDRFDDPKGKAIQIGSATD